MATHRSTRFPKENITHACLADGPSWAVRKLGRDFAKTGCMWLNIWPMTIRLAASAILVIGHLLYNLLLTLCSKLSIIYFFNFKFDHPSYSKYHAKYHFFCCGLLYQIQIFSNNLNLHKFFE